MIGMEKKSLITKLTLLFFCTLFSIPSITYAAAGDGLLSYGDGGQKYNVLTGPGTWGGEQTGPVSSVTTQWTQIKASPANSGVYVMAMVTSEASNNFKVYSYSGGTWSAEFTATQSSTQYTYRLFDVAFENTSGNVLVVYGSSASTTTLYYQEGTWNGSNYDWTTGSTTFATSIGNLRWLILENKLNSDEMLALAVGDNGTNNINAKIWSGSAFGNEGGAWGLTNITTNWNFDAANETASGDGMAAWGISASPYWKYATYVSGTGWTVTNGTAGAMTGVARQVALDADPAPASDRIAAAFIEDLASDDANGAVWGGSSWTSSPTNLDAAIYSTVTGKQIDVQYVGTTGNAIIAFDDAATADLDWSKSTGGGAFAAPTSTAIAGGQDNNLAFSNQDADDKIMLMRSDNNSDIYAYYYDDSANAWTATNGGAALETASSGGTNKLSFAFDYESVFRVDALGIALIVGGVAILLAILLRRRVLYLRKAQN